MGRCKDDEGHDWFDRDNCGVYYCTVCGAGPADIVERKHVEHLRAVIAGMRSDFAVVEKYVRGDNRHSRYCYEEDARFCYCNIGRVLMK